MGNVTLAMSVAPALGPAVSGVVLQWLSWRWMFGLVLPVAVVIAVLGLRRLTNVGVTVAGSVDWFSVVLSAVGFGGFVYGLSQLGAEAAGTRPAVRGHRGRCRARSGSSCGASWCCSASAPPLLDLRTLRAAHLHGLAAADGGGVHGDARAR